MNEKQADEMIANLEAIKKLLVLQSLDSGHTQGQIATTLGTTQATISRMFPGGVPKAKNQ